MKKSLITLAMVLMALSTTFAQTDKGNRLMGVNVGNITIPTSGGSGTIISLQPTYGWFVSNNLAIGAGIPFFNVSSNGSRATQIGLTPFLRYYIGSSSQMKPFLGASLGVVNTSASSNNSSNSTSSTDALYSLTGGLAFFINRSVSFDLGLTYTGGDTGSLNTLLAGSANALTPNIPKALNLSLGFQVYFGK